ncbi:MAG TPA: DNA double-strand break repair nuclease NurA [Acidimicrobiales bacterium]|nr:DNA double-strand break repair nuclease NurA [Acidimicrobiales bacterium]
MEPRAHPSSLEAVAAALARLLSGSPGSPQGLQGEGSSLVFEPSLSIHPLEPASPDGEVWAVDGGQALVADARCFQVYVTRSARVCWSGGACTLEEQSPLNAWLLGPVAPRTVLDAPVQDGCTLDVNLLREWGEWTAAAACVAEASPASVVLVDGDLEPDWRLDPNWLAHLLDQAEEAGVVLAGVTKHTALSWGGAPLLGVLERQAAETIGARARWWVPVARSSYSQVVVARLDPDARFAFRVDLPASVEPERVLGHLCAVCDDAAFPGYPYPLSAADRLAACPGWVRQDTWAAIDELLERAGVPADLRERAFADRHRLMERY